MTKALTVINAFIFSLGILINRLNGAQVSVLSRYKTKNIRGNVSNELNGVYLL